MKKIAEKIEQNKGHIFGIVIICVMLGLIVLFTLHQRKTEGESIAEPEELVQEYTIENILTPKNAVRYFIEAIKEDNIDKGLRVFPIDERTYGLESLSKSTDGPVEWNDMPILSGDFSEYTSIASAELVGSYTADFAEWRAEYNELGKPDVTSINYIYPNDGAESELQANRICQKWSIEQLCEMEVIFEKEKEQYRTIFAVVDYGEGWKIFSLGSSINETTSEVFFERAVSASVQDSKYDQIIEEELLEDYKEKSVQKNKKEIEKLLEDGEALLPGNYFMTYGKGRRDPNASIRDFMRCIQRKDFVAAMGYGVSTQDYEHVTEEALLEQGKFAKQMKVFLYNVMLENSALPEKIDTKKAKDILEKLKPEFCFDIEIMKIEEQQVDSVYQVTYFYGNKYYQANFFMKEGENGWQIQKIEKGKRVKTG